MSFSTLGSESQICVFKQCQSNTQMSVSFLVFFLGGGVGWGEHAQKPKIRVVFSVKKIHKGTSLGSISRPFHKLLFLNTIISCMWLNDN